jgi:cellulose synthase/poly-beta-1,6-N-acetylglucosamine synthase-like glycosyltransferase
VDDGSTDTTAQVLHQYYGQIQIVRTQNQGAGMARNMGIQIAKGEYVAFLDSDDVWFPWTVNILREVISQAGQPAVIQTNFIWLEPGQELPKLRQAKIAWKIFDDVLAYGRQHFMSGAGATVVKCDALKKCGGFSKCRIVGEDIDLLFKLGTEAGCVLLSDPPSFAYCRHDGMTTLSSDAWFQGAMFLLQQEKRGVYSGGSSRLHERRQCLARDAAYRSLMCLKAGDVMNCLRIYLASFTWQIRHGWSDYLWKTPLRMMLASVGLWPSAVIRGKKLNER